MKRPSFQFYPADWKNNAKLRRCSEAARGAWIDILCVLHDSDEYGVLRWPLEDVARSAGVSLRSAKELSAKAVLKGGDSGMPDFTYTPHHAGQDGETVVLIKACSTPCWFSSRMVTDEWIRQKRGVSSQFRPTPKPTPNTSPKGGFGGSFGDGPTSPSPSPSPLPVQTQENGFLCLSKQLCDFYKRPASSRLTHVEESTLAEIVRERPEYQSEWEAIKTLKTKEPRYFPQSMERLLSSWQATLDRANNHVEKPAPKDFKAEAAEARQLAEIQRRYESLVP